MGKKEKVVKKHFPKGRFIAWKTSDVSSAGLTLITTSYLTLYCTNYLGLSSALVGTILLVSNIIDAITDLLAGFVIDNTHSKLGKGRPYELGIVGMWICTALMFCGPVAAGNTLKVLWVFFMYTFCWGVFNTLRGAGSTAYLIRAFDNDKQLVGKVGSYGGIVTTICSSVVSMTFPVLMGRIATSAAGWRNLILLYAIPLCVIGLGRFVFVKENPAIDAGEKHTRVTLKDFIDVFTKNKFVWFYAGMILIFNLIQQMSVLSYYFTYIVGSTDLLGILGIMSIVMLPFMLIMPVLMRHFSLSGIIMVGTVIAIGGYLVNFIAGGNIVLLMLGSIMTCCATLPLSYLCAIFLMDLFNYNEYKGLARLEGTTNQLAHGFAAQIGQGLGGYVLGMFLQVSGFVSATDGAAVQPASAIMMIRCLFSVIPAAFLVILLLCVWRLSKLDRNMPQIEKELNERKRAQKAEQGAEA